MKILKAIFSRTTFLILAVLLEILILVSVSHLFGNVAGYVEMILRILGVFVVLGIVRFSRHLSSDLVWIIVILLFPVPGTAVYLLLGANLLTGRTYHRIRKETKEAGGLLVPDEEIGREMEAAAPALAGQFRYLSRSAGFPFFRNEGCDYYPLGDVGYPAMLDELKKAERFIFLEYFIVEEGEMWNGILEILEEKAAAGVDVRVLYDDAGSYSTLPWNYAQALEKKGISCIPFNRINPVVNIIMNHRDHRKILVIDGKVAFSGGINLADEYINRKTRFGHWKDNVIRIRGEAVWPMTVLFLTHWNALRKQDEDFSVFRARPEAENRAPLGGYLAPYGETPLDSEITAQNIYMGILNQAVRYCYIFTPYLIIDTEFENALILAAKHGVDVRIVTPGIPDKKLVYSITRSYYRPLIRGGVRIYEYTPGFIHSKVFVCDDRIATVGTINLDYRSLYLHFENGVYLFDCAAVADVRKDAEETIAASREVTLEDCKGGIVKEFFLSALRLVAPLL